MRFTKSEWSSESQNPFVGWTTIASSSLAQVHNLATGLFNVHGLTGVMKVNKRTSFRVHSTTAPEPSILG